MLMALQIWSAVMDVTTGSTGKFLPILCWAAIFNGEEKGVKERGWKFSYSFVVCFVSRMIESGLGKILLELQSVSVGSKDIVVVQHLEFWE